MARRTTTVVFTLLGVALVLSLGGFFALYLLIGRAPTVPSNATLTMEFGGDLAEVAPADVVSFVRGPRTPTVRSVVENFRKAKADRRVSGIFLKFTGLTSPYWAKAQEVRDAILDFRASGKPVYAYLEFGGDRDYYLASAADKVFLMPSSPLDLNGVATYAVFLRGALDKLGVYPDLYHIGDYKTYSNQLTEKTYTAAHREMDASLNGDLYGRIVADIAAARHQSDAAVRDLLDRGPFLPDQARAAGLVDEVAYEDQAIQKLRDATSTTEERSIAGDDYSRVALSSLGLNRGPRVAVIYVAGEITSGKSGFDPLNGSTIGSDTLIEAIRAARKDTSLKAIVLRIDSPGGSVVASDAIWRELMLARTEHPERPIVASMSDLAASGGYYIATPAQSIVAQPSTLTGSIGIVGGKFVTGGLYEKLGAHIESQSVGKHAEMNSPVRPYSEEETRLVKEELGTFYQDFVKKVAESRHSTPEQIDRLGQGRVWTGQQAKANGLVDEIGGLTRAVAVAKSLAGLGEAADVELVTFPAPKTFYQILSETISGEDRVTAVDTWMAATLSSGELDALRAIRGPGRSFRRGELLALMPFRFLR